MLLTRPRSQITETSETGDIHNFYEALVQQAIINMDARARDNRDFLADVACVALNHLPPRYIRHDVDMNFYMSPAEREEIENKVNRAVRDALDFVDKHQRQGTQSS